MKLEVGTVTDRGLNARRPLNEDRLLALPEQSFFAVCDGVGGHNSGEVASQAVVDALAAAVRGQVTGHREDFIELTLQRANRELFEQAARNEELDGMASTVALVWLNGTEALVAHVGDSRVYHLSNGQFSQITTDHTVVEDALRSGQMTKEEAADHPMKHVINRAMGIEPEVEPEFNYIKLAPNDTILLCSDGITGHIDDRELAELLGSSYAPQDICEEMRQRCYDRGAEDNLTAVVVRLNPAAVTDEAPTLQTARSRKGAAQTQVFKPSAVTAPLPPQRKLSSVPAGQNASSSRITVKLNNKTDEPVVPPTERLDPRTLNRAETPPPSFATTAEEPRPSMVKRVVKFLLMVGLLAGAFYGGMLYVTRVNPPAPQVVSVPVDQPQAQPSADPAFNNGVTSFNQRQWLPAVESFTVASRNNPQNSDYLYWLARAQFENRQYKEALENFQKAQSLNFSGPSVLLYEALSFTALSRPEEAQNAYRRYAIKRLQPQTP